MSDRIDISKYNITANGKAAEVYDLPPKAEGVARVLALHFQMSPEEWRHFREEPELKMLNIDVMFLLSPGVPAIGQAREDLAIYDLPARSPAKADMDARYEYSSASEQPGPEWRRVAPSLWERVYAADYGFRPVR